MEGFWILHQVTIPPRLLLQTFPKSISKAAALNMTQSMRAILAGQARLK